jgi:hypothetical protein
MTSGEDRRINGWWRRLFLRLRTASVFTSGGFHEGLCGTSIALEFRD